MSEIDPKLDEITQRIIKRSKPTRDAYLEVTKSFRPDSDVVRAGLSAGNQAHAYAGCALHDKACLLYTSPSPRD